MSIWIGGISLTCSVDSLVSTRSGELDGDETKLLNLVLLLVLVKVLSSELFLENFFKSPLIEHDEFNFLPRV